MMRTTEQEWRARVDEQERSGLAVREFAAARGITAATLYWWRSKLRRDGAELVPVEVVDHDEAHDDDGTPAPCFELQFDGSMILRVPPGFDEAELRRLQGAVRC